MPAVKTQLPTSAAVARVAGSAAQGRLPTQQRLPLMCPRRPRASLPLGWSSRSARKHRPRQNLPRVNRVLRWSKNRRWPNRRRLSQKNRPRPNPTGRSPKKLRLKDPSRSRKNPLRLNRLLPWSKNPRWKNRRCVESPPPPVEEPPVVESPPPPVEEPPVVESPPPPVEEPPVVESPPPPVEEPPVVESPPPVTEEYLVAEPEPRAPVSKETSGSLAPAAKEAPAGSPPVGAPQAVVAVGGGGAEVSGPPMDSVVGVSTFYGPGDGPVIAEVGTGSVGAPTRRAVAQLAGRLSCELSALGGPTTESCTAGLGDQRLLSWSSPELATAVTSFAATTAPARGGGGHGGSAIGSSPVNPTPGPAPSGASGSAAGACGIALSGVPTLASLPLSGTPCATRRLRLSCQSWRTTCFRLIPERPG